MNDRYQDGIFPCVASRLITRASAEKPGLRDYTVKRNFRRDLDQDIRREGYDLFWPNITGDFETDPGTQPYPNGVDTSFGDPITLITQVKRPNGETATVVGTKTKLWRFSSLEVGAYFEGTGVSAYFEEPPIPDTPYFNDNPGDWVLIGSGFSTSGHRWEALNINGYLVLNNGVDLPMTFRVEDDAVKPIYELREQGIASVGTIGESDSILLLGDISHIKEGAIFTELMSPIGDISSGYLTASQSTNTVSTYYPFFTASHVGRWLIWADGTITQITAFTDSQHVTVSTSATVTDKTFTLRNKAVQLGSTWSAPTTGTMPFASFVVTASAPIFSAPMVGSILRFASGFSGTIVTFTDSTHVTLDATPALGLTNQPFWIVDPAASYTVASDAPAFTDGTIVGKMLIWDTGETRKIVSITDDRHVIVDTDTAQPLGYFRIENPLSYSAFTSPAQIDRIQFEIMFGMRKEPRRWGAAVAGNMATGSNRVTLNFPTQSFEPGQEIVIPGAGVSSGSLTATILSVASAGTVLIVDETASSLARGELVQQSDSIDAGIGSQDLDDDSSPIIRILKLGKFVVVYTSTAIFVGFYTGDVTAPFDFTDKRRIPQSLRVYYRWTLVNVGGQYHIFAAENSFYRFDLTVRIPELLEPLDLVSNLFYTESALTNTDSIFACENSMTDEIWIRIERQPLSQSRDPGICFDYKQLSVSTIETEITAGATIEKPRSGPSVGVVENWFVMGSSDGTLVVYGKTSEINPAWDAKQIFYERYQYPFVDAVKTAYESSIVSGEGPVGTSYNEQDLKSYVITLASQSQSFPFAVTIRGYINPGDTPVVIVPPFTIASGHIKNLIPLYGRTVYLQDEIKITGFDNPIRLAARIYDVTPINSQSHTRRP